MASAPLLSREADREGLVAYLESACPALASLLPEDTTAQFLFDAVKDKRPLAVEFEPSEATEVARACSRLTGHIMTALAATTGPRQLTAGAHDALACTARPRVPRPARYDPALPRTRPVDAPPTRRPRAALAPPACPAAAGQDRQPDAQDRQARPQP